MNWKQLLYKIGKGALTGAVASFTVLLGSGLPVDKHGVLVAAGTIGSAALHGVTNAIEQALGQ